MHTRVSQEIDRKEIPLNEPITFIIIKVYGPESPCLLNRGGLCSAKGLRDRTEVCSERGEDRNSTAERNRILEGGAFEISCNQWERNNSFL